MLWWAELSKTLIPLSADVGLWFPSLLVVWPEATQHRSLPGLFGGASADSEMAHVRSTSQNFCCQCPCPHGETQPPPTSAGGPPTLADRFGSVSYGVTAPSPGSRCAYYFVCALQEWSFCSPSPVKVLQSKPARLLSLIL